VNCQGIVAEMLIPAIALLHTQATNKRLPVTVVTGYFICCKNSIIKNKKEKSQ